MDQEKKTVDSPLVKKQSPDRAGKYLAFELDDTEFAIQILKVVELLKVMEITVVPMWPSFAKGTINLRGKVIPVVDLRQKFGLSETEISDRTCIIVVELGPNQIGIVVEAVNEVREIPEDNITDPPDIGGTVDSGFILGMGKADGDTIILLNIEKILIGGDMDMLQGAMGAMETMGVKGTMEAEQEPTMSF